MKCMVRSNQIKMRLIILSVIIRTFAQVGVHVYVKIYNIIMLYIAHLNRTVCSYFPIMFVWGRMAFMVKF